MHLLNRIIQRPIRVASPDGGWYFYQEYFVSCGCGWHDWFPSESAGENAWVDHMEHELVYDADGNLVASHPR